MDWIGARVRQSAMVGTLTVLAAVCLVADSPKGGVEG